MVRRKKKRHPKTELEITRAAMRKLGVFAMKPFKMRKWILVRFVGGKTPVGVEIAWERKNIQQNVGKFASEEIALRNAMLRSDFVWRR